MRILSLFDGISCAKLALDASNIKYEEYLGSEIDNFAMAVSKYNHDDIIHLGDINNIDFNNLPKIDLIMAGSPCQDLSSGSAKGLGLNGSKSKLFFKFIEALEVLQP